MKTQRLKKIISIWIVTGLGIFFIGCRPSVDEVANRLYAVPLGVRRDQLRNVFVEAYGKKYPNRRFEYGLVMPLRPVTAGILKADKDLVFGFKRDHRYVRVYPSDLFEKMPPGALTEPIGMVAEAAEGNGSVSIYYDSRTNYIGFLAYASGMDD